MYSAPNYQEIKKWPMIWFPQVKECRDLFFIPVETLSMSPGG